MDSKLIAQWKNFLSFLDLSHLNKGLSLRCCPIVSAFLVSESLSISDINLTKIILLAR